MNFVMVFGSAIIALLILLADPIVALLGGADFAESAVPLRFVGIAVMCSAMNIVLANVMISKGMERTWAMVNAIGLALAVLANVLLIPQLGVVGSAISISLCEALMLAMRSYVCRGFLVGFARRSIRYVFCSVRLRQAAYAGRDRDMRCRDMERLPVADVRRIPVRADIWHRVAAVPRTIRYGHASAGIQPTACTENE